MSSASPSFTLPSATDVLLASPSIGPAVCTPSLRSPITASPARPVSPVRSLRLPFEAPFAVQSLPVHSGIEILPQPPRSSVAATTAPLTCASSLTERALRSQRRDALRALHDVAVPSSSSPVHLPDTESRFGAQTEYPPMQPITPRQAIPIHNYSNSAPAPRVTTHVADHLPFTVRTAPLHAFSPLAPLRASSSTMPSTMTLRYRFSPEEHYGFPGPLDSPSRLGFFAHAFTGSEGQHRFESWPDTWATPRRATTTDLPPRHRRPPAPPRTPGAHLEHPHPRTTS